MQTFRTAVPTDAQRCFEIEAAAYSASEAATLEKITKRIAGHPQGFVVLEVQGKVIGFINSGCAHEVDMSDDDFKALIGHDPDAPNVVILSVVVDPAHHGNGHSRTLMREFVRRMIALNKQTIHLMCKDHYVPLYEKFGYRYSKLSTSSYGGVQWHEMVMPLAG
ncbi:GNAT family N-acetyltransferase [Sulfitobacter mediterraneus]|uniref:GNAT family N-acetyltransferase n=1 Tax=Sulfitobacter mediterraneus TaxID=83219 RepID=UPI001932DE7F|nr:GNAT family N-acetyltransferase [Sulfitobacter mediterraneus]MBM1632232.1 GNAT family N-acetyltransferase [Sulfitobacter mediterraneus]MBM1640048.1 GNAT family N-acetyltransferase [Sulfitobacter mediterraneus]MBM1644097.1 GNAT family N-acetyltransferase [Sulfitobacter mediterraneus]MBM1648143.1 GNAT family N-acetyltransferase [Sulfitobacter mediterraneus]MBM1652188.1 GNAT family N-acetyltransferase [Sulfitobacter mediterraneus]